jgi:drug/metabolite transporter (DMT)-like permease
VHVLVLSLAAALAYGAADFAGGVASRRVSALAVVLWSQAAGLLVLLPALAMVGGAPRPSDLGWGAACGVVGAIAIALFYRALAVGVMGLVSPLTAVLAAVIPVVFGIARGERPAPAAALGIAFALAAVVLVSAQSRAPSDAETDAPLARPRPSRRLPPGIPEALGAGFCFGFFLIALAQTSPAGGLYPLLSMRAVSIAAIAVGAWALRRSLRVSRPTAPVVVVAGLLDMAANVSYILASRSGPLSVAAVVTSLYPGGTVALAALLLRERLGKAQWIGVALALAGVLCIALAR